MGAYADKLQKTAGQVLRPGERLVSAIRTQPRGDTVARGVGGLVGGAIAGRQAKKAQEGIAESSTAKNWPTGRFAVGLTDQRLLTFSYNAMGKPKEMTAELPLQDVANIELESKKLTQVIRFDFSDGSSVAVECARLEKVGDFVNAFQQVKAGQN